MAFFKFPWFGKRSDAAEPAPLRHSSRAAQAQSVEQLRQRARRRLMGAAVLIGLGVIGFPMLFDSQPRPIPVDIPIEIPDRNQVAPLVVSGEQAQTQGDTPDMQRVAKSSAHDPDSLKDDEEWAPPVAPIPQPPRIVAPAEKPAAPPEAKTPAAPTEAKPEVKPEPKPAPKPEAKPDPKPTAPARTAEQETARAKAILEGRTPPPAPVAAAQGRFIVQVGAFADVFAANEVRRKLEGAGLKTYTQAVNTKDGQRIRVRLGPFSNRDEAQKAADRAKALGLAGAVLTL